MRYQIDGDKIRLLLKERRISVGEFARMLGISRGSVSRIISGKQRPVRHNLPQRIAEGLQVPLADLAPNAKDPQTELEATLLRAWRILDERGNEIGKARLLAMAADLAGIPAEPAVAVFERDLAGEVRGLSGHEKGTAGPPVRKKRAGG